jgi:hypothetical protein
MAIRTRQPWFLMPAGTAAAAAVLAQALRSPVAHVEHFTYVGMRVQVAGVDRWWPNVSTAVTGLLELISTGGIHHAPAHQIEPFYTFDDWPLWVSGPVFLTCAAIAVFAVKTVVDFVRGKQNLDTWINLVLLLAIAANVGAYVTTTVPTDLMTARYLLPAATFAMIGLARTLPYGIARSRPLAVAALAVVVIVRLASFAALASTPAATDSRAELEEWLAQHDLHRGYGPYWDASMVTVATGSRVQVRQVNSDGQRLFPHFFYSKDSWYAGGRDASGANFVIFRQPSSANAAATTELNAGISDQTCIATFGSPAWTASVDGYRVLVWDRDISADLGPPHPY